MNHCKRCGDPAPEGKELCWGCSHGARMDRVREINTGSSSPVGDPVPEETACEACRIPDKGVEEHGDKD